MVSGKVYVLLLSLSLVLLTGARKTNVNRPAKRKYFILLIVIYRVSTGELTAAVSTIFWRLKLQNSSLALSVPSQKSNVLSLIKL